MATVYYNIYMSDSSNNYEPWLSEQLDSEIFSRGLPERPLGSSVSAAVQMKRVATEPLVVKHDWDPVNTYEYNSKGYRSPEFQSNVDLLAAGCSNTHGDGIPGDMVWSTILAKTLGLSYANLGTPGSSIPEIVNNVFRYIHDYGDPKVLVCLFPDPYRVLVPHIPKLFEGSSPHLEAHLDQAYAFYGIDNANLAPSYMKKPYQISEIVSKEFSIMLAITAIYRLEDYCAARGINFTWSTWDLEFSMNLDNMQNKQPLGNFALNNYLDIENDKWKTNRDLGVYFHANSAVGSNGHGCGPRCSLIVKCHEDVHEAYPGNFNVGTDCGSPKNPRTSRHWGVHRHIHIADSFMESLK
jgi:hypothetical protein